MKRTKFLSTLERRAIFADLVRVQDAGQMTVAESIKVIADRYDICQAQLKQIEHEGISCDWPPLTEDKMPSIFSSSLGVQSLALRSTRHRE